MNFSSYNHTKNSGIKWIGRIPEHWDVIRLKFLSRDKFLYGANESGEEPDPASPRFIRITDIDTDGTLKEDTYSTLPMEKARGFLLEEGDILLARSGATVGKAFIYEKSWGVCCFAGYLIRLRTNVKKSLPFFLYYYTQSNSYWHFIEADSIQATIENFSAERYANIWVPLPPVEEQKSIVCFLKNKTKQISDVISMKHRMINLLQEKHQAIISNAVTKGFSGSVHKTNSGIDWIGEIPSHWELKKLKFVTHLRANKTDVDDDCPYVGLENIESKTGRLLNYDTIIPEGTSNKFESNDILFGKLRPYLAKVILTNFHGRCSSELLVLESKSISPEYLFYVIISDGFIKLVDASTYGAKMPRANWEFIGNILIPIPPSDEQSEIAKNIKHRTDLTSLLISNLEQQITKLVEYKKTLISNVVTGKIDIRKEIQTCP